MTSFAKATFDAAGYLACRPNYPTRLWDIVCKYHALNGGRFERALDVGCGPGFVALSLAPHFSSVRAIDPAKKMVDIGLQPSDPSLPRIQYGVGFAEDLGSAGIKPDEGVDLVIAGQAAHWFDYPKVWREFSRFVRPGGTVAFVGYAEMIFPRLPHLSKLIAHHSRSPEALGDYWQPGRRIVEAYLEPVPFPIHPTPSQAIADKLPPLDPGNSHPKVSVIAEVELPNTNDFDFSSWDPSTAVRLRTDILADGKDEEWLMRKTFTRSQLEGYMRTWSALHSYHEAHPEDKAKQSKGKDGDIVDRVMEQIWEGVDGAEEIEAGWPLVLMMIKKKAE